MPKISTLVYQQKFKDFLKTVFPSTKFEVLLFIIFITVYGILGSFIALNYRIIFDDRIPWDAYFSFDNRAIVMTGGGFERHPLANYFFDWIREFAFLFSDGKKDETFRLVLAWCSNFAISLSLIQIYKYLKNIIVLPKKISLLIVAFFAFFSTNILLSFTPETYTYTLFFLVLFNYYAALKMRKGEKIPAAALILAGISDVKLAKNAERYIYKKLFIKNIEIYEYQRKVMHGKISSCDNRWVSVGSYNINNISAYASVELNLELLDAAFANEVSNELTQIIKNDCKLITESDYESVTGFFKRIQQRGAYDVFRLLFFLFTFYFKQHKE